MLFDLLFGNAPLVTIKNDILPERDTSICKNKPLTLMQHCRFYLLFGNAPLRRREGIICQRECIIIHDKAVFLSKGNILK